MRVVLARVVKVCAVSAVLAAPSAALAQFPANQTLQQSCAVLAQMVQQQGAVLLPSGYAGTQRYVRDQSFCAYNFQTEPAWVRATDNPQCFIGYTCRANMQEGGDE